MLQLRDIELPGCSLVLWQKKYFTMAGGGFAPFKINFIYFKLLATDNVLLYRIADNTI